VFWIDDDRLIFSGYQQVKIQGNQSRNGSTQALYIWQPPEAPREYEKKRRRVAPSNARTIYCASQGLIYYDRALAADGFNSDTWFVGPPGRETLRPYETWRGAEDVTVYPTNDRSLIQVSDIRCAPRAEPSMLGREWFRDDDGTHYLDFGPDGHLYGQVSGRSADPVELLDVSANRRIQLPVTLDDSNASCAQHDPVFDRFIVQACPYLKGGVWPSDECHTVWLVDEKSGATTEVCIPVGPWSGARNTIVPTAAGLFFVFRIASRSPAQWRGQWRRYVGLYSNLDDRPRLVVPGYIDAISVSPSGCKVAFAHLSEQDRLKPDGDGAPTFKVLSIC